MYICLSFFSSCFVLLLHVDCVILSPHIGIDSGLKIRKSGNLQSLIHNLRNYRLNQSTVTKNRLNHSHVSDKSRRDSLKKFYLEQQNLFLKELILPCLKAIKSTYNPDKSLEKEQHTNKGSRVWEYRVSNDFNKLKCSVLSEVPKGTVLMRPNNSKCEFISLPVLNSLFRTRTNIMKILYPKHNIKDLNEVYKYASFETLLLSQLCSSDKLRSFIISMSLLCVLNLSRDVLLDLFFILIRSNFFWNRNVYTFWTSSFAIPFPMLVLTAKKLYMRFFEFVSSLDDRLKESLISVEGEMLNKDLRGKFNVTYVKDRTGNVRVHNNYFDM